MAKLRAFLFLGLFSVIVLTAPTSDTTVCGGEDAVPEVAQNLPPEAAIIPPKITFFEHEMGQTADEANILVRRGAIIFFSVAVRIGC